jgi:hypothetical protein
MRVVLKPMGLLILAIVPSTVLVLGLLFLRSQPGSPNSSPASAPANAPVVSPVNLDSRSPIRNGSFEEISGEKTPVGWDVDLAGGNSTNVSYAESRNPHSGAYHGTHYGGSAYDVRTTQTLTGLKNGKYLLRAWTCKNPGTNASYLVAKDFDYSMAKKVAPIYQSETKWQLVEVRDIEVQNNQCVVGFFTKADGGRWIKFDDIEFIPQE